MVVHVVCSVVMEVECSGALAHGDSVLEMGGRGAAQLTGGGTSRHNLPDVRVVDGCSVGARTACWGADKPKSIALGQQSCSGYSDRSSQEKLSSATVTTVGESFTASRRNLMRGE